MLNSVVVLARGNATFISGFTPAAATSQRNPLSPPHVLDGKAGMNLNLWLRRPDYLVNRMGVWLWERTHPNAPWLTADMVRILDDWLKPTDHGIEFGGGRSTAWLATRTAHLVTIEYDRQWLEFIRQQLKKNGTDDRVDLRFVDDSPKPGVKFADCPFVRSISDVPDASVDFALVDGGNRANCVMVGMNKLKSGGILVFDDVHSHVPLPPSRANRGQLPPTSVAECTPPELSTAMNELNQWRCIWTGNGVQDCALWLKP